MDYTDDKPPPRGHGYSRVILSLFWGADLSSKGRSC